MAENIRGLTVPADNEGIDYRAINRLGDSINDFTRIANDTERDQMVADLTAAGLPTDGITIYHEADKMFYARVSNKWEVIWQPTPRARRFAISTAVTITSATTAPLTMWEIADGDGGATSALTYSNGIVTTPVDGEYRVDVSMLFSASSSAQTREIYLLINGSTWQVVSTTTTASLVMGTTLRLNAGTTIQIALRHAVPGDLRLTANRLYNTFSVALSR